LSKIVTHLIFDVKKMAQIFRKNIQKSNPRQAKRIKTFAVLRRCIGDKVQPSGPRKG
jgi:hypothetical protein